jgi:hypothetical protein
LASANAALEGYGMHLAAAGKAAEKTDRIPRVITSVDVKEECVVCYIFLPIVL